MRRVTFMGFFQKQVPLNGEPFGQDKQDPRPGHHRPDLAPRPRHHFNGRAHRILLPPDRYGSDIEQQRRVGLALVGRRPPRRDPESYRASGWNHDPALRIPDVGADGRRQRFARRVAAPGERTGNRRLDQCPRYEGPVQRPIAKRRAVGVPMLRFPCGGGSTRHETKPQQPRQSRPRHTSSSVRNRNGNVGSGAPDAHPPGGWKTT
jgi:hypothetical protein